MLHLTKAPESTRCFRELFVPSPPQNVMDESAARLFVFGLTGISCAQMRCVTDRHAAAEIESLTAGAK